MSYKLEFRAHRCGKTNRHFVSAEKYYEYKIHGEWRRLHCDSYPLVGDITGHSSGCYEARYHTSRYEPGLGRVGYMQEIDRYFSSLEAALAAVEEHYDAAKDNLIASPRYAS